MKATAKRSIVLHARDLAIVKASFTSAANGTEQQMNSATHNSANATVELVFEDELPVGPGALKISFTGEMNDQVRLFFF